MAENVLGVPRLKKPNVHARSHIHSFLFQEQLKQAENELLKCVQKPNAAAKKSIEKLLEKINSAVKHFKNFILQLYKNCFDTLETVLQAQKWLYSITFLCHKKMGHPAHACLNFLAEASDNCEAVMPDMSWKSLCRISPSVKEMICYTEAKTVCPNARCVLGNLPVLQLQEQLDTFKRRAMNILYVKIEAHQTYAQANRSHTYHEEYQGMATEIRQKTDQFLQYFDFMSVIFGIFILVLFVKVVIYRHKFLTEDHYDNRYITSDFVDIDNTRAAFHMETILPLEPREKMQYIKVTSVRLVPCERVRLLSSFVFLIFATFKIIIHMLTDSSLYWILSSVRREERLLYMSTIKEEYPVVAVRVKGEGLVASLFQNVTSAVRKESSFIRMDPTPCLPDPVPPDWNRYYQILALVIICWLLALWEPYGLRLRHTVMVTYHPDRARERAIWLYNRIISNRISFVKMSRRLLRRKYKDVSLNDTFRYKFFGRSTPKCLLCEETADCVSCVQCVTPKCAGVYCASCFSILKFCSICRNPAEYSDMSDVSEERDSSEEEHTVCENVCQEDSWEIESEINCPDKALIPCNAAQYKGRSVCEDLKTLSDVESVDSEKRPLLVVQEFKSDIQEKISQEWMHASIESVVESNRADQQADAETYDFELAGPSGIYCLEEDRPKPDFNFRQMYPRRSSSLLTLRGSCEFPQLPSKYSSHNKCDVGVLAKLRSSKAEADVFRRKTRSSMSANVSSSLPETISSEGTNLKLPFIDPINVHEFIAEPERTESHSTIHAELCPATHSESHSAIHTITHLEIHPAPHSAMHAETRSTIYSATHSEIHRGTHSTLHSGIHPLTHLGKSATTHSTIFSATHSAYSTTRPEKQWETRPDIRPQTSSRVSRPSSIMKDRKMKKRMLEHKRKSSLFEKISSRLGKKSSSVFGKSDPSESVELWCTENTSSSLSDNDGQFYSQPYLSSNAHPKRRSGMFPPPLPAPEVSREFSKELDRVCVSYSSDLDSSREKSQMELSTVEEQGQSSQTLKESDSLDAQQESTYFEESFSNIYGIFEYEVGGPSEEELPGECEHCHEDSEDQLEFVCQCEHDEEELKKIVLGCGCQLFERLN